MPPKPGNNFEEENDKPGPKNPDVPIEPGNNFDEENEPSPLIRRKEEILSEIPKLTTHMPVCEKNEM